MEGLVENLWTDQFPVGDLNDFNQSHAYFTAMVHLQVAPERHIKSVIDHCTMYSDGTITGFLADTLLPWMLKNKPDTGFRSLKVPYHRQDSIYSQVMPFCTLCNSAGNDEAVDFSASIIDKAWLGIGALNFIGGTFNPEYYSSVSEYVDFSSMICYVPTTIGTAVPFNGTSCAAPFISGMIALVNDFFYQKIGRPLSFDEIYEFIKSNCKDITSTGIGKDNKTGWGVFILPDPESIDTSKYKPYSAESEETIVMDNEFEVWAKEAGQWAIANGILKGDEHGNYMLSKSCTRQEMIVFLYRLYKLFEMMR
jgi:hypothetical protein